MRGIAANLQCPLWVISCRDALELGCPLYRRKLPRLSPISTAAMGQHRTYDVLPCSVRNNWTSCPFPSYAKRTRYAAAPCQSRKVAARRAATLQRSRRAATGQSAGVQTSVRSPGHVPKLPRRPSNVCFGSKAAATVLTLGVRFTAESCRDSFRPARQLRAITRHRTWWEPFEELASS
jgi:hypothetical protein